eukprot:307542_1
MYVSTVSEIIFSEKVYKSIYCMEPCNHQTMKLVNKSINTLKKHTDPTYMHMKHLLLFNNSDLCKTCIFIFFPNFYDQYNTLSIIPTVYNEGVADLVLYPHLSKFVYHKTNIWLWTIHNVYLSVINIMSQKDATSSREILFYNLRSLIHHIILFKKRHWKVITFECTFVITLIEFIEFELKQRLNVIAEESGSCLHVLLLFITNWLFYFNKYCMYKDTTTKGIAMFVRLSEFIQTLLKLGGHSQIDEETLILIKHFLLSVQRNHIWKSKIDYHMRILWKKRKYNQQCQRMKCKTKRQGKRWYKCSSCLVSVYCSRRCAKKDWKYGYHRNYCAQYTDIKNDDKYLKNSNLNDLINDYVNIIIIFYFKSTVC